MDYRKLMPPPYLKDYIRYFWLLESSSADTPPKTFKTIPDGSPGLIFQHADSGAFYQCDRQLPVVFLYGQTTRHTQICSPGRFQAIGVYFYPHALNAVFGLNASELTDTCMDIGLLAKSKSFPLTEELLNIGSAGERVEILSSFLYGQIGKNSTRNDARLVYIIAQLARSGGNVSLRELQERTGLSERSFERRFRQHVGMPPKLFSRICRFQASLDQLRNKKFSKFSDIAFGNEYADQSHFIRTFKEFTGVSPQQYRRQTLEIVENFPHLI